MERRSELSGSIKRGAEFLPWIPWISGSPFDALRIFLFISFLFILGACTAIPGGSNRTSGSVPVPSERDTVSDLKRGTAQSVVTAPIPATQSQEPLSVSRKQETESFPGIAESEAITSRLSIPSEQLKIPDQPSPVLPTAPPPNRPEPEGDTVIRKDIGPKIPIVLNAKVRWFVNYFTGPYRKTFTKWLERSTRYADMMRGILREERVPEDLFYIALIESGYNPKASSWAGATGIWQFMKPTARMYGLKVNWWIDERRDPEKATRAAARYFRDLHQSFHSWHLAQAGYNAGEARIRRGLRRVKRKDFWTLAKTRYIARETRNFVPKFVAAAIVAKNPEAYGFTELNYQSPRRFEKVRVSKSTDLRWIASAAGVSLKEIQDLNPALRRWRTPPKYPDFELKVPVGTAEQVATAVENWSSAIYAGRKYKVERGDTLSEIALNVGTTIEALMDLNGLSNPGRIYIGQELLLPDHGPEGRRVARVSPQSRRTSSPGRGSIHVVRSGETIWHLSRRYQIKMKKLLTWNHLSNDAQIRPGDKILLLPPRRPPSR